jgi:hypothetical protein
VHGVGPPGVDDPRFGLVEGLLAAGEVELGPALHHRVGIEELVVHAEPVEHRRVALDVPPSGRGVPPGRAVLDDQAPGPGHQRLVRLRFDLPPRLVRGPGQRRVLRFVLSQPDDPGVVLRRAPAVPELELLDPENAGPELLGQSVQGRRAEAPAPHHDRPMCGCHNGRVSRRRPFTSIEKSNTNSCTVRT